MSQEKHGHMCSSAQDMFLKKKMGDLVSRLLRDLHEKEPSPVKRISQKTGIAPNSVKRWYTGKKAPNLGHFAILIKNYPEILKVFLELSGHGYLVAHIHSMLEKNMENSKPLSIPQKNVPIADRHVPIDHLNQRQHWFLVLLQHTNKGRAEDITLCFGVSLKTARRDIKRLKMAGKIRFIGARKTGNYEITDGQSTLLDVVSRGSDPKNS